MPVSRITMVAGSKKSIQFYLRVGIITGLFDRGATDPDFCALKKLICQDPLYPAGHGRMIGFNNIPDELRVQQVIGDEWIYPNDPRIAQLD